MKINIGAGNTKFDGFKNCDYSDIFNPDFQFDMEKDVWPFKDNSIDEVIANHVLEHMGEGFFHCIKELYRVCKNNAIIRIQVPHYLSENMYHDPTHRRPITPRTFVLMDKEYNKNDQGASSKLGLHLNVDFIVINESLELNENHPLYERLEKMSKDQLYAYAYERVNVFSNQNITLKVRK